MLNELAKISSTIDEKYENMELLNDEFGGAFYYVIQDDEKKKLIELLNETLMLFLPPFNVAKPEL